MSPDTNKRKINQANIWYAGSPPEIPELELNGWMYG